VARGLAAGRVQSVAVRLIIEREREIQAFIPQEYWSIEAELAKKKTPEKNILAKLYKIGGKTVGKLDIKNKAEADKITNDLEGCSYVFADVEKKQNKKTPPNPFTTSTLQQTANRWLGYSAKQTMRLAQQLYEMGLITYMRTDSLNLSDKFLKDAQKYLKTNLGEKYALSEPRRFKTKSKGAQEAHEAVRPTEAAQEPASQKENLNPQQYKLYNLIWQRAIACQMPEAVMDATGININAEGTEYQFRSTGQTLKFDGYLKIYPEKSKELQLPEVKAGEILDLKHLNKEEHFTKPPGRYSDAGLVKILEAYGIGRPSTYAPTLSTIEARNYVARDENKKLMPTDIAFVVNDLLVDHFPRVVDYQFTAKIENELDRIAEGDIGWRPFVKDFYEPFHKNLEAKYSEINKKDIMPEEKSNEKCDKCGAEMVIKTGRYGKFLACSAYPDCKNIKGMNANGQAKEKDEKTAELEKKYAGEKCEKCGSDMAVKTGRFGPFLACTSYPKCKNIKNIEENNNSTGIDCPKCGQGQIVQKRSKRGIFYACNKYPDCKNAYWSKPTGEKCPTCGALMVAGKDGGDVCSNKECGK
jgi:DNA topoisomerase-1